MTLMEILLIESNLKEDFDTRVEIEDTVIKAVAWKFPKGKLGKKPIFIFSDIYGNDVTVKLHLEE